MYSLNIVLPDVNTIKTFVSTVANYDVNANLKWKDEIINAKSIMGIFSMDTSKPIELEIEDECPSDLKEELKRFIA